MNEKNEQIIVEEISVDFVSIFYFAAAEAINRVKFDFIGYTGKNAITSPIKSACIEAIMDSFLGVESLLNKVLYQKYNRKNPSALELYLKQKWHVISINHKLQLLIYLYSDSKVTARSRLFNLFNDLITFRNTIVHANPEEWERLVTFDGEKKDIYYASPKKIIKRYPNATFSIHISEISIIDAEKAFEISLLVANFLDSVFNLNLRLIDYEKSDYNIIKTEPIKNLKGELLVSTEVKLTQGLISPNDALKKLETRYFIL